MYEVLDRVNHPHDLKGLSLAELERLASEIRQRIAEVVDKNGGHFGSNLGVVELTLALHRVFDFPNDRLVLDTSHQSYPHKLITGRKDRFHRIRQYQGLCGFCNRTESVFDLFDAGHAGTACGLATGVAVADRLRGRQAENGRPARSIALVGDSAIQSGMSLEALNHAGEIRENLIVVLNDNKMSIDHPVGAISAYLNRFRTRPVYQELKRDVARAVASIPVVGKRVEESLERMHGAIKHSVGRDLIFQEFGFQCYGPVDGHDLRSLIELFENLKRMSGPILVHAHTEKGHGYAPALRDPVKYHALKNFLAKDTETAAPRVAEDKKEAATAKPSTSPTYSDVFRKTMADLARRDRRVAAITAGMAGGTGLSEFAQEFPDRFFDVGIAEQHGAALAAGLTEGGMRPIFAVYSTFCQRAYDQFVHDVCLQAIPAIFCLDRGGLAGEDGWTHHGVLDIAYMRCVPNCVLMAPRDGEEFVRMLQYAVDQKDAAVAIRYPKANVPDLPPSQDRSLEPGKSELLLDGDRIALFAYGSMVEEAYRVALDLREQGIRVSVVNARWAKPIDVAMLRRLAEKHDTLVTLEEHNLSGGFGSAVAEAIVDNGIRFRCVRRIGIPDRFVSFGSRAELMAECGIDGPGIRSLVVSLAADAATRSGTELSGAERSAAERPGTELSGTGLPATDPSAADRTRGFVERTGSRYDLRV
jgi:1-deoxy-D-xylulose-5-phosphate synthase